MTGLERGSVAARRLLAPMITAVLLAGCVVGPDYQTPILAMPASWSGHKPTKPAQPAQLSKWWQRLRDPELNTLVEEAVAGNLDVATAKAKIREARASYRQSAGTLLPSVDGSGSATRNKSAETTSGSDATYSEYQAGFDASWELDLFGANRRGVEAARYGLDASQEELRSTLLTLVGDVASYYTQARGYQARIALARRSAASQRQTAELTRTMAQAGTATAADVAKAMGQAASTEAAVPTLEASYAQAVHRLAVLAGRPPASLSERLKRVAPIPAPRLPMPTGIPADLLLSRPDLRMAERQYAQYTAKIGQAEAARYPSVSLTGDISTAALKLGDLGKNSSIGWSFGPTLSVPLFNAGQLQAAVEVAKAQRDQYFIAYRSSVLTALEDVENALVLLSQERIRIGKLASSAKSYGDAARLEGTLYKAGETSLLDVLDAQRSLYSAEDSLLQSRVLLATNYIALNKALGGGWDGTVDSAKPEIVDVKTGPRLASKPAS
ncbi:efflux transporter outer membrane subunit [Mesorhizobium sp. M7A.F.Ca.CA.001.07.2.1]|uniref:efflux transporter outer membrane subunit n=1 Tax=Mesorhizobium TaxID=68287 RepID=UPI000FCB3923|nr:MULTISPECIES: efflux transporter outer membrane subunit [Mesorhizobium]RVB46659.1 efflux transporter outer membrane subunit [Mesorhizobium sp. M7A.F.Ca.CA.004.05.1.1]MCF6122110.1 efflux transporter outer membrane subunit [Mesorhizobium ciceri]MCQ8812691.1 efflux transporter outer membrane subunit [Mesorhizobium sp. SEMIA396]RUX79736.1 efflux transporter outer membrane subunit [Mesorhizobium sp. M7A.F.Ca.CA.004.08.2.1]RUX87103.1 efflux transporter outer membrane subunit [Mesorhizobium sp. M7